jgi:hypothetical protein
VAKWLGKKEYARSALKPALHSLAGLFRFNLPVITECLSAKKITGVVTWCLEVFHSLLGVTINRFSLLSGYQERPHERSFDKKGAQIEVTCVAHDRQAFTS